MWVSPKFVSCVSWVGSVDPPRLSGVSGISGMEWWNGLLEWNTGMN